jgi:hypothetical protein
MRGWGRDGLGARAQGRGREGAEGVDVDYALGGVLGELGLARGRAPIERPRHVNLLDVHACRGEPDLISHVPASEEPDLRDQMAAGRRAVHRDGLAHAGHHHGRRHETGHQQPREARRGVTGSRSLGHSDLMSTVSSVKPPGVVDENVIR